jgi:hypothetical protein
LKCLLSAAIANCSWGWGTIGNCKTAALLGCKWIERINWFLSIVSDGLGSSYIRECGDIPSDICSLV